ncbi:hypothetical protein Cgig2_015624 [Carnegiea gigantea]|uniref:RRM domain-containing protein n=1 Tax=Carnegiea gigantea TaxID=171969 RepID=A0A9Q1H0T2_9CARY|nr:hypothetical protein Cgig2_015624 [Carnegiea gigantea]
MQQRLKQQQALMQQSMLQQHTSVYHPGLLAAPQIEPILSGNLPPGFDSSTCRSVTLKTIIQILIRGKNCRYVGNIHPQVSEPLLQEVFSSTGPIEGCKLIRKEKSSYGFVDYYDRRSASLAIVTLNGRHLDARVMWDQKTGRSRGFGFVSFRDQQDAQSAINDLNGKWLGSRQIRCNWATKGAAGVDGKGSSESKSVLELTNGALEESKENASDDAPENNPQYTTVYVGNLAPEVTSVDLHRHFHALGAGAIEDVRVQRDKGFGFVRYSTHAEAARAIQLGNAQIIYGKPIKCSWGSKPTPSGTSSTPLPPPAQVPVFSTADLAAYERQLALSKMGGAQALMQAQAQGQLPLKPAAMSMGAAVIGQAVYDGGFQNANPSHHQQLMYYH